MKLTFKGVDISTEEKFVSYINSLNTAIMKQNAMNEIKQDLYDVSYLKNVGDNLDGDTHVWSNPHVNKYRKQIESKH